MLLEGSYGYGIQMIDTLVVFGGLKLFVFFSGNCETTTFPVDFSDIALQD